MKERVFDMREIVEYSADYLVIRIGNVIGKARINRNLHVIGETEFQYVVDEMKDIVGYKVDGVQQKGVELDIVEMMRNKELISEYMESRSLNI